MRSGKFAIGDRVNIIREEGVFPATIRVEGKIYDWGLELDRPNEFWFNLDGLVEEGYGDYADESNLVKMEEKKMDKFNIGDRVLFGSKMLPATIRKVDGNSYGLEFDTKQSFGHLLGGTTKDGFGWWATPKDFTKIEEKKKMFNVGDRVMVRYWDDMKEELGVFADGCIVVKDIHFMPEMKHLSGRQATIKNVSSDGHLTLGDWSDTSGDIVWTYTPFMFCLVKKVEPKKKLSVAEIEKMLGYGIEVIKEDK